MANREALMYFEDASPYSLLVALGYLNTAGYTGLAWRSLIIKFIGGFRSMIREKDLHFKDASVKKIYARFRKAQTLEDIIGAFQQIRKTDQKDEDEMPMFIREMVMHREKIPEPIDEDELIRLSDLMEDILKTTFDKSTLQVGNDNLRKESDALVQASRWHILGTITRVAKEALFILGTPQEVAKATMNTLGLYLPEISPPSRLQLLQLLPSSDSSSGKEEEK